MKIETIQTTNFIQFIYGDGDASHLIPIKHFLTHGEVDSIKIENFKKLLEKRLNEAKI